MSWETIGSWWDKQLGDGDYFHNNVIFPNLLPLVSPNENDFILDLACGNGILLKILAEHGSRCVGVDFSINLLKAARKRIKNHLEKIQLFRCDLTNKSDID